MLCVGLFVFYFNERLRGRGAEWEVLYVAFMEVIIYVSHIAFHGAAGTEARDSWAWDAPLDR